MRASGRGASADAAARGSRHGVQTRALHARASCAASLVAVVLLAGGCAAFDAVSFDGLDGGPAQTVQRSSKPECEPLAVAPEASGTDASRVDTRDPVRGCSVEVLVDEDARFTIGVPRGLPDTVPEEGPYRSEQSSERSEGGESAVPLTEGYPGGEAAQEMAFRVSRRGSPEVYRYGTTRQTLSGGPSEGFTPVREVRAPENVREGGSGDGHNINISRYELSDGLFVTQRIGVEPAADGEKATLTWTAENTSGEPVDVTPRLVMDPPEEYAGQGTVSVPGRDDIEYEFSERVSSLPSQTLLVKRVGAVTETAAGASMSGTGPPPSRLEVGEAEELLQPDFHGSEQGGTAGLLESSGAYALTWPRQRLAPGESVSFSHEYGLAEAAEARPLSMGPVRVQRLSAEEALKEVPRRIDGSNNAGSSPEMYSGSDLRRFPAYRISAEVKNRSNRTVQIAGESLTTLTEGMSVAGPVKPPQAGEGTPVTGSGIGSLSAGESAPVTFYVLLPAGAGGGGPSQAGSTETFEARLQVSPRGAFETGGDVSIPAGGDSAEPPAGPSLHEGSPEQGYSSGQEPAPRHDCPENGGSENGGSENGGPEPLT